MKDVGRYFIQNKNIFWSASICLIAAVLTIFILNTVLGLLVYYVDPVQSVFWHVLSPYLVILLILVIGSSIAYEFYVFRKGGHSLAKQLKARQLSLLDSTPEESVALHLTERLSQTFEIDMPTLYVLPDEVGVNALTAGFHPKDTVIILTWGAL